MKAKKGQTGGLQTLISATIVFMIAAALLFVGGLIMQELRDTVSEDDQTGVSTEAVPEGANNTFINLVEERIINVLLFNTTAISGNYNLTEGVDFEMDSAGGRINITNATWDTRTGESSLLFVNYTFLTNNLNSAFNTTLRADEGLISFAEFLPIIATVAAAAVVIGLIAGLLVLSRRD